MEIIERRILLFTDSGGGIELRARGEGKLPKLAGYANRFGILSHNLGGFRERTQPGVFEETIRVDDIMALWQHDRSAPLGRNRAGTLELAEDNEGLTFVIDTPDTAVGRDLITLIERGDVSGMSFSFQTLSDAWDMVDGEEIRTLIKARLLDVSPVTFPAYPETDVAVAKRSLELWQRQHPGIYEEAARRRLELADAETAILVV